MSIKLENSIGYRFLKVLFIFSAVAFVVASTVFSIFAASQKTTQSKEVAIVSVKYLDRARIQEILNNFPSDDSKKQAINNLVNQGYVLEGLNDKKTETVYVDKYTSLQKMMIIFFSVIVSLFITEVMRRVLLYIVKGKV